MWVHKSDLDRDGRVTEADFVLFKLQQMQRVDPLVLDRLITRFKALDVDGGLVQAFSNRAVCWLKLCLPARAVEDCSAALLRIAEEAKEQAELAVGGRDLAAEVEDRPPDRRTKPGIERTEPLARGRLADRRPKRLEARPRLGQAMPR